MSKLVSLKMPKAQMKGYGEAPQAPEGPRYPWGTRIELDTDALKKLGIDLTDYEVGQGLTIEAKAEVVALSSNATGDGKRETMSLQMTHICIEGGTLKDRIKSVMSASRGGDDDEDEADED